VSIETAKELNSDCHSAIVDRVALERTLHEQGEVWHQDIYERCPHLFAAAPLFISSREMEQMHTVIEAVEQVVALPAWRDVVLQPAPAVARYEPRAKGVFFGYDFHLKADGAHLIEINTNAGGALFNALQLHSQRDIVAPGTPAAIDNLEQAFLEMFRNEWRLEWGDAPLQTIVIVDEQPHEQYFYPEFVLMQQLFEQAGIAAFIADPAELEAHTDGLYLREHKIDLIYNRLTDFSLQQYSAISTAYQSNQVVLTPHPHGYALYADKRNLALLTSPDSLRAMGVTETTITTLILGIPQTRLVDAQEHEHWRQQRKQWFFKPATGYGGKGTYRGASITTRVFADIMLGGYIAQRMAPPGERMLCLEGAEAVAFKSDVRCYVYDGLVQLIAARLYQGQTTNFRTAGGGFAPVRVVA
jgi:hypothetical protein